MDSNRTLNSIERLTLERQLADLQTRIIDYESRYGVTSQDFYARFKAGELGDTADYVEWATYCDIRDDAMRHLVNPAS